MLGTIEEQSFENTKTLLVPWDKNSHLYFCATTKLLNSLVQGSPNYSQHSRRAVRSTKGTWCIMMRDWVNQKLKSAAPVFSHQNSVSPAQREPLTFFYLSFLLLIELEYKIISELLISPNIKLCMYMCYFGYST